MDILTLIDVFSFEPAGGAGRVMFESARELAQRGHTVTVVCRRRDDLPERGSIENVRFRTYKPAHTSAASLLLTGWNQFQQITGEVLSTYDRRKTIVHTHHALPLFLVKNLPEIRNLPIFFTFHSPWHLEYRTRVSNDASAGFSTRFLSRIRRYVERKAIDTSDRMICLSDHMKNRMKSIHGTSESKLHVVPGAVDVDRFSPDPSGDDQVLRNKHGASETDFVLLTIRSLIPRTGIDRLIRAFRSICDHHPDVELWIGGTGPKRAEFEQLAETLNIRERITFLGYIPENELPSYYRTSDLFVVPTRALEGFGLVIVESLSCGTPVLATPVGGIPEILKPFEPDLLLDGKDVASIRTGLERACSNPNRFKQIGNRGRTYCEKNFSWTTRTDRLEQLMHSRMKGDINATH